MPLCKPKSSLPGKSSLSLGAVLARIALIWIISVAPGFAQRQPLALPPPNHARILHIENRAEVRRADSAAWDPARAEPPYNILNPGDEFRALKNSRALVLCSNGLLMRVTAEGYLRLPAATEKRTVLTLLRGWFYFFDRDATTEKRLQTPVASLISRRTEFVVEVAANDAEGGIHAKRPFREFSRKLNHASVEVGQRRSAFATRFQP